MIEDHEAPGGDLLAAAASEAQAALKTGWREAQHDEARIDAAEQAARAKLAGYNDRQNERARQQRRYISSCPVCASPIYADPGICTSCAFFGEPDAVQP